LKYRSLLILITAFIVFMAVVSSPTVNLLSNNYLLYHYQALAAKARAHVMNDNDDDNSAKDTAATTPVICPNGSELTDSAKCKKTIQDKHPENPITIIPDKSDNSNDKHKHITIQQDNNCKKGNHFDFILDKCVKDTTPVENQQQTRRADTESIPQQDTTTENPQAVHEKGVDRVIGSCNNLGLNHDIKTGLCVTNEKTITLPSQLITVQQPLPKQNDNTGGGGSTTGDNKKNSATDTQSPPSCPKDSKLVNEKCETQLHPDDDCLFNPSLKKCKSINGQCPPGFFLNDDENCVPDKKCPKGFEHHNGDETGTCHPVKVKVDCTKNLKDSSCLQQQPLKTLPCTKDSKLVNGKCQYVGIQQPQNVIVVKTQVDTDTVTKNFISKNIISPSLSSQDKQQQQPTFLLLLDTAQLCQIAGDTQCVAKQNQFKTLNLLTKFDETGKSWTITGQADNVAAGAKTQRNVQVIAYFYDSKGNNVGGVQEVAVNPTVIKSLQLGAFNIKASTSTMKGTPSFLRLEYQSTTT
jgi:hypothetical protein